MKTQCTPKLVHWLDSLVYKDTLTWFCPNNSKGLSGSARTRDDALEKGLEGAEQSLRLVRCDGVECRGYC